MAFVQTNVNYASEYSRALADAYPYLSYFSAIWAGENASRCKPGLGRTMYIPALTTSGAKDADRDSVDGAFRRNWDNQWQAVELQMDREWNTLVDPLDLNESGDVATIANITRVFAQQAKVPEMDAFLASKLASFAADFGGVSTTQLSAANILENWDAALEYMVNQRARRSRLVAYMTPAVYKLLKQASGLTRFVETGNVDRSVARLDGVEIVEVPEVMMKTAYTFTEGWAVDSANAQQINLLLVDPSAVAAPIRYETAMMSAPTAQSKGKYLYYERYYYGAFALSQRQAGIWANLGAAPALGALTVTSKAGTKSSGDTVITVSGKGLWPDGSCQEGLKMVYCTGENAAVSLAYGAVPPAAKTWVEMTENPATIASQTAGKYITVAEVNRQTGFVVAGGSAVLVVKS